MHHTLLHLPARRRIPAAARGAIVAAVAAVAAVGLLVSHSHSNAFTEPAANVGPPAPPTTDSATVYFPSQYELHAPEPGPHIEAF